jgi:hypothetical protein
VPGGLRRANLGQLWRVAGYSVAEVGLVFVGAGMLPIM